MLLGDFLEQQLAGLHAQHPAVVDSGLALDLLAFHTTPLGTAEERTLAELRDLYRHQDDILLALVRTCQDLYLLTDPSADQPVSAPASRLAHDTLAPLVRARFDESDAPGQRARRVMESRAVDWRDGALGMPLDEVDLAMVETGIGGMRGLTADEERLLAASRAERTRRRAEEQGIAAERAAAQERQLVLEQQSNRRLRLMLIASSGAVIALLMLIGFLVTPRIREMRDIQLAKGELVRFQGGVAVIGTNQIDAEPREKPEIHPQLPSFGIEKYEVSNYQYALCVRHDQCEEPTPPGDFYIKQKGNYPVVNVHAVQAADYCRWIGRRLPTELEWERAARGAMGRQQPWEDNGSPLDVHSNIRGSEIQPITSHPEGKTPEGVFNLWGNVWEWTASYNQNYENYILDKQWDGNPLTLSETTLIKRGNGANGNADLKTTYRYPLWVYEREADLGFRCAAD